MTLAKSLILGSAAALVAVGGAQAADLPVKAKAVEYVKVCSLYGPGFYYIPGTDTCIKLGGFVRADLVVNGNGVYGPNTNGASGANNRFTNGYTWRSREDLNIDTRTATEYGVVRTYFDAVFTWTSDSYAANGAGGTVYSGLGSGAATVSAPNNANSGAVAAGTVGVYYASSSSPASPLVSPSRSSLRPGLPIRATTTTPSSVASTPPTASTSSPTPRSSATASRSLCRRRIRLPTRRLA